MHSEARKRTYMTIGWIHQHIGEDLVQQRSHSTSSMPQFGHSQAKPAAKLPS